MQTNYRPYWVSQLPLQPMVYDISTSLLLITYVCKLNYCRRHVFGYIITAYIRCVSTFYNTTASINVRYINQGYLKTSNNILNSGL